MRFAAIVAIYLLGTSPASAQAPHVGALRSELRVYDTAPEGTTRIIASLGALAHDARGAEAREARFLRAVASVDLLLIARRRADGALADRVAAAYGVDPRALVPTLRSDLESLRSGGYRECAEDAIGALNPPERLTIPPAGPAHSRAQATFFAAMFEQLVRAEDPANVLLQLAADPCDDAARCPQPYAAFGPRGRRAIAAMTAVHEILASLERTAALGDPFSAALAQEVLIDSVVLRSMTLSPHDWAASVRAVDLGRDDGRVDPDAVVVVTPDHVRVGWVPHVEWDSYGRPRLTAPGSPLVPDTAARPVAVDALAVTRLDAEHAAVWAASLAGASRVALVIEPGVEADRLSLVLSLLEQAGVRPAFLAGAARDATVRGARFEAVHGNMREPVGVFIRLGGFSAWQPNARVSLPRRRVDGVWQFDMTALEHATRERREHPVSIRYMSGTSAELVLRVAVLLHSERGPVRLTIP